MLAFVVTRVAFIFFCSVAAEQMRSAFACPSLEGSASYRGCLASLRGCYQWDTEERSGRKV